MSSDSDSLAPIALVDEGLAQGTVQRPPADLWADAWRRLQRNRAAVVSLIILGMLIIMAVIGPWLSPYRYDEQNLIQSDRAPSLEHWLGTDRLGRDVLSRLLIGARVSLVVAFVAQVVIVLIGLPAGLLAGYLEGWVDNLIMRTVEVFYSIPTLLLIILVMTALREALDQGTGPITGLLSLVDSATGGLLGTIIGISVISWVVVARLVRGRVLSLKKQEFIVAAQAIGAPASWVMRRHLLPNSLSPVIVAVTYGIPQAIFLEAGLSFIGMGVRPPMASWGLMIAEGARAIQSYPYLVISPALILALTMICFTFLGDGLRDALDPRLKS
jgi:oligopeptide transport system permease protein